MDLKAKKVLVTGGCGFIGVNLTLDLLKRGAKVVVLDLPTADWSRLPKDVVRVKADILNRQSFSGRLEGIEIVYHLAARTDLDGKDLKDYSVNFDGTKNVILEAQKSGKLQRFVFYSTQLVVGIFNETRFIDESEPYRTKTVYGQSKIEGEKVVKKYCKKYGVPYTTIRPTSVYGPWGGEPYKAFFATIKKGRYFHVGSASNLVSMVYVKNLVDLTVLVSVSRDAQDQIYFGNDFHPYTMRELVDEVARYYKVKIPTVPSVIVTLIAYGLGFFKLLGVPVPLYPFRLKNIKANYCYDVQKSVRLGYNPQYDLRMGVKETLDWYEKEGSL